MTYNDKIDILKENVQSLSDSIIWLQRLFTICNEFVDSDKLTDSEFDAMEALTARFARTTDILTNKVLRSITYIEHGESLTWIDSLIYFEKQELISTIDELRLIKELRNDIVHEYTFSDLIELFTEVTKQTGILISIAKNTLQYVEKVIAKL
ncbi:MAG: hypothetical protein H8E34_11500 [Bacteroidetes bacterium]|nr:hypothetical protein [Bacteroidota bacterium]